MERERSTCGSLDAVLHQDMATSLLAAAIQASHALEKLEQLAADHPNAEPAARADLADAIATMTRVRTRLIRDADSITDHD